MRQTDANPGKETPMRLLAAVLIALATPALSFSADPLPKIVLKGGEGQMVGDTGVTLLLTKVDDARCPADVECYWEGMIRVEITVMPLKGPLQEIVLCNLCDDAQSTARIEGMEFTLLGLAPSKEDLAKLGRDSLLTDYSLTLAYGPALP
jgi:hypothetical protein